MKLNESLEIIFSKKKVRNFIKQIDKNGYSERFAVSGKVLIKTAVVFSSEGKGIVGWKVG